MLTRAELEKIAEFLSELPELFGHQYRKLEEVERLIKREINLKEIEKRPNG